MAIISAEMTGLATERHDLATDAYLTRKRCGCCGFFGSFVSVVVFVVIVVSGGGSGAVCSRDRHDVHRLIVRCLDQQPLPAATRSFAPLSVLHCILTPHPCILQLLSVSAHHFQLRGPDPPGAPCRMLLQPEANACMHAPLLKSDPAVYERERVCALFRVASTSYPIYTFRYDTIRYFTFLLYLVGYIRIHHITVPSTAFTPSYI